MTIQNMQMPDHLWRPITQHSTLSGITPPRMVKGEGVWLTDDKGNRFIDSLAGLWTVNVGYGRKEIAAVAAEQMEQLAYLAPMMTSDPVVDFAEKLQTMLGFEAHVYFSVSGSEANETAIKMARQYHLQNGKQGENRFKIISRYRGYHGNTLGAMTATGQAERKMGYEPGAPGFVHVMPPYPYRRHEKLTVEEHGAEMLTLLEETIIHEGAQTVAAVLMEPMITGGGVLVPPDNYVKGVREICDRYGVLLIFDEVVSGFGRLGQMFGHRIWGTEADIFTFAKGLASGYMPIAATVAKKHIFDGFLGEPGEMKHFRQVNTFGGHTVACAVGLKNVQIIEDEDLPANGQRMGDYFRSRIREELGDHPLVGEVRGMGLLTGIEMVSDRSAKTPLSEDRLNVLTRTAIANGIILGRNSNTIPGRCNVLLIAPPLVVNEEETDRIVAAIKAGVEAC
ncbi:Adenosylmethionine-8-amino-7-oxononanoate aminotransferase [Cribrihabitans marinus]|uniref:Adenosylmethionine-8-amino-7-oxononanoate aminotransferase n=1 Tax=Cribrihabitans marinus TaxID=1227549 RepID=A0A1H7DS56_9RHOB|nr:aminotransferase [Cribrihabitans marinus]GGH39968.1 aspartate aminotransferase family protein [Cribrihabitans marinus]SEK04583.1 Adenosylmethionine-8-amino-7-oxononanoate aminotransferase [Cribrihabitans marinus]